ncbi:PREDICTED: BAHD acyltransferase At5g47980-like [Tarenaya hassleriana]|uniref:BAHD acyltransferase At5g47980-like n=1 Tax=Tarenaya hassleriana TaxID=28532 RepID=UPI00053C513E|nr:PREDICTED: BAHD acyltransferase At5g47980-like [Tarenaya hassleriana]
MGVKVELMSKEVIKPATPTPDHLRTLERTLFDQVMPQIYINAIFFYSKTSNDQTLTTLSQRLKNSLSEILTRFYPLAGRMEGVSVNCNDEGALFTEARADTLLSDYLTNPDAVSLKQLIINPCDRLDPGSWPLLHVKVSFFRTEGVAVAVSVSHEIFDVASFLAFVRSWADSIRGCAVASPQFIASTFYPPADLSYEFPPLLPNGDNFITKRSVFDPSKIKELKSRAASEHVPDPTRVEAVEALLFKAIKASRSNEPFATTQTMNLRPRLASALAPNAMGNFFYLPLLTEDSEGEMKIAKTVIKLRKTKDELSEIIKEDHSHGTTRTTSTAELGERVASEMLTSLCELSPEMDKYLVTSLCRMPFYDVDFGWGRPVWVATYAYETPKMCILMDARDGEGIEVWVNFPEGHMLAFEHDQDLLSFATPNPRI